MLDLQGAADRLQGAHLRDVAELRHLGEHLVAPVERALRVLKRVQLARSLREAGQ